MAPSSLHSPLHTCWLQIKMCFALAYWQVERERRKLKKEFMRASRAGSLEMREAMASSPTQQVTCFSHLPLSSCPCRNCLCSAYPRPYRDSHSNLESAPPPT